MATAFAVTEVTELEWVVPRHGGGQVTATRAVDQAVIYVDRAQEMEVPEGGSLLSSFLDAFDAEPGMAEALDAARREVAAESIASNGGPTLRDLRLAQGMSQSDLALALGTSQSRVSLIESRQQKPTEERLRALAKVLGADFNTLMDALARGDR